jgi:DNA-binding HxlR family transcriptional regulator
MRCSIARSLDIIGESWSLLILRDILQGSRRFDELQNGLGIATNVLTARLARLTGEGLLERRRYQERPVRFEYLLTEKGRDLSPILVNLVQWGNKYLSRPKEMPQAIVHNACAHVMTPRQICSHCEAPIGKQGLSIVPSSKVKTYIAALRKRATA